MAKIVYGFYLLLFVILKIQVFEAFLKPPVIPEYVLRKKNKKQKTLKSIHEI